MSATSFGCASDHFTVTFPGACRSNLGTFQPGVLLPFGEFGTGQLAEPSDVVGEGGQEPTGEPAGRWGRDDQDVGHAAAM